MAAEMITTFDSYKDTQDTLDMQAQDDRLSAITHDAFKDDPTILLEHEQNDRFEAIAASLGGISTPELVLA